MSSIAVNLSAPNSSLILAGRSGVGRKTAVRIVASLYSSRLITLNLSHTYSIKTFKIDLKSVSSNFKYLETNYKKMNASLPN